MFATGADEPICSILMSKEFHLTMLLLFVQEFLWARNGTQASTTLPNFRIFLVIWSHWLVYHWFHLILMMKLQLEDCHFFEKGYPIQSHLFLDFLQRDCSRKHIHLNQKGYLHRSTKQNWVRLHLSYTRLFDLRNKLPFGVCWQGIWQVLSYLRSLFLCSP